MRRQPGTAGLDGWPPTTESGLQACYGKSPGNGAFSIEAIRRRLVRLAPRRAGRRRAALSGVQRTYRPTQPRLRNRANLLPGEARWSARVARSGSARTSPCPSGREPDQRLASTRGTGLPHAQAQMQPQDRVGKSLRDSRLPRRLLGEKRSPGCAVASAGRRWARRGSGGRRAGASGDPGEPVVG